MPDAADIARLKQKIRDAQEMLLSPNPETEIAGREIIGHANEELQKLGASPGLG